MTCKSTGSKAENISVGDRVPDEVDVTCLPPFWKQDKMVIEEIRIVFKKMQKRSRFLSWRRCSDYACKQALII